MTRTCPAAALLATFRAAKPEGTAVGWFANGQKSREVTYRAGEAQGLWVYWHENGQKREEGNYEANKREGKLASHGVAWKTDALTQNERYLERNSGSARRLQRVPAFWDEPWTKWPFGPLYSSDFLTQRLVIEERDGQPKLVFVVPVSN